MNAALGSPGSWADPLALEACLSDEERLIAQTARGFARDRLAPRIVDAARRERFDPDLMREMGALGLLGVTLPEEYGGAGASHIAYGLVAREVERIDSAFRSALSVQSSLVMHPIYSFGDEAQRRRYLPRLAAGELVGCFGLTEAEGGSDPRAMRTTARAVGGGYVLNGAKTWITNAPIADLAIVWAKLEGAVRGFIVERGAPGFSATPLQNKLSLRASITGSLFLEDVLVPREALLSGASGLRGPFSCLNKARFGIAWGAAGAAEACWHAARDYTLHRQLFGAPLAAKQIIQLKLADMQTEIALSLAGALRLGQRLDEGDEAPEAISMLKRNNVAKALAIARAARDMLGANGVSDEFPVMRHMMNLETVNTYEGTSDVHALVLGRWQTGLAAF